MEFRDEIAATGELSPIGQPLRRNVDKSFRRGIELEAGWQALDALRLSASVAASRNRISTWTQFYDVYDANGDFAGSTSRTFHDVEPVATPPFLASLGAETTALPGLTVGATGRYVAASWLDNANTEGLVAPGLLPWTRPSSSTSRGGIPAGSRGLKLQVNNVLDNRRLWPNGYSYLHANRAPPGPKRSPGPCTTTRSATRSVRPWTSASMEPRRVVLTGGSRRARRRRRGARGTLADRVGAEAAGGRAARQGLLAGGRARDRAVHVELADEAARAAETRAGCCRPPTRT